MSWIAVGATAVSVGGSVVGGVMGKKKAPGFAGTVDWEKEVGKALRFNEKNLPRFTALANKSTTAEQTQALALLEQAIPGISGVRSLMTNKLKEDLTETGLPQEVSDNLRRKAAEMGVSRGTSGQFNNFSLLRDFGINELDYNTARRARALQMVSGLMQVTPRVSSMSPARFMVTNQTAVGTASDNLDRKQAHMDTVAGIKNENRAAMGEMVSGLSGMAGAAMGGGGGWGNIARNFTGSVGAQYRPQSTVQNYYNSAGY